ncbi:MAG: hypothetical protein AAGF77_04655 [Bacteroidota bacterium]
MAVLKKVKASTLMETMVATVLIVVIFSVASLIMNSLTVAQSNANTNPVAQHLSKLRYAYKNQQITIPYVEDWKDWEISVSKVAETGTWIRFNATHQDSKKTVTSYLNSYEQTQGASGNAQ